MAFRGVSYYRVATQTDSPPAGVVDLVDGTSGTGGQSPSLASSTSAATTYQIKPQVGSANFTSSTAASTQLANNAGWQVPTGTSGMATSSSTSRVLSASQTLHFDSRTTNATGTTTNFGVVYAVYRRSAAGALTLLGKATSATMAGGLTGSSGTFPANYTPGVETVFANGETLYVEVYVTCSQATLTAGSMTLIIDAPWSITGGSGNGLAFRYATTSSDSAPISSDVTSQYVIRNRAVSDSAPASDTLTRGASTFRRSTSESAPASDTSSRQLTVVRKTSEYLGGAPDYPVTTPATIAGTVTTSGLATAGATCRLLRDSDEYLAGTTTTDALGRYSFTRDVNDPNSYHVEVYVGTTLHGLTDRGLTPS